MSIFFDDPQGTQEGYELVLNNFGFTGVKFTRLDPKDFPEAVLDAVTDGQATAAEKKELSERLFYFKVESDQGSFGMVHACPPFVDLSECSFDLDGQKQIPFFDESVLYRIWQKLVSEKLAKPAP